jgi:hypothetical protein
MDYCRYRSAIGTPQIMSECISWPILIAILGAAFGLLFIALLVGCLLTHGSERWKTAWKSDPAWGVISAE